MAAHTKKALKAPDPFLKFTIELWEGVYERRWQLGAGLLAIFLAAVAYAAYVAHQHNLDTSAGNALSEALRIADRPVKSSAKTDKDEKAAPASTSEPPFASQKAKETALAKALNQVISQHPNTPAARDALLPLAHAQMQLGQLDQAKQTFQQLVASAATTDPAFRALGELGLAQVAVAQKDYAGATQAYDELQRDAPHDFLKDRAALGKARMLEVTGKKQQAAAAYQEVKVGFAGTPAAREASARLAFLESEGIQPPSQPSESAAPSNLTPQALGFTKAPPSSKPVKQAE